MGRLGKPEEIKGPAIFLESHTSSFVIGAILPIDGGNLASNAREFIRGVHGHTRSRNL